MGLRANALGTLGAGYWPHLAAACGLLGCILGTWVGYGFTGLYYRAQLVSVRADAETARAQAVSAALQRERTARAAADAAQASLAAALATNTQITRERDDAITKVTAGSACLRGAALRLLDGAPGLSVSDLPVPAARPAGAHGPTATDPERAGGDRVVTDTGIARWSLSAGLQYEECRTRLDALIDYSLATAGSKEQPNP